MKESSQELAAAYGKGKIRRVSSLSFFAQVSKNVQVIINGDCLSACCIRQDHVNSRVCLCPTVSLKTMNSLNVPPLLLFSLLTACLCHCCNQCTWHNAHISLTKIFGRAGKQF